MTIGGLDVTDISDCLVNLTPVRVLINGLFGKFLKGNEKLSGGIGALAVLVSFICAIVAFAGVQGGAVLEGESGVLYEWIAGEGFTFNIGFHVDALTTVMLLVITGVGFLYPRLFNWLHARRCGVYAVFCVSQPVRVLRCWFWCSVTTT